jgi:gliding motility-associated-like protein
MKSHFLLRYLLCFLLLCGGIGIGANKAYADHISSTEMYVDYIGTGPSDLRYKVTFITFRVCIQNNLILFPTVSINVKSANAGAGPQNNFNVTLTNEELFKDANGDPVFEDTLDNLCPDFSKINSCRVLNNVNYSGYTMRRYSDTVTLPSRQTDWIFSWSSCCRLLSYVNIDYAAGPSFYLEVGMNNLFKFDNSTPRYSGQPFAFLCANQPGSLSNLPSDPDGDSLSTIAIDPQQSTTTFIQYYPGYTSALPTGAASGYNVGRVSGKATFTPPLQGKYALGYRTSDYDKATRTRLSYTSRDLVITVLNCTNLPPYIDSIPQGITGVKKVDTVGGEVVLLACPSTPLAFTVNAHSNNPNGLIYMRPSSTLPAGMTIVPTVTGGTGYVTVNWTPGVTDIGTHVVSVIAVDSTCAVGQEITLRNEFTFTVDVRPALDAGPDLLACPLGDRPVKLGTNANPSSKFAWTNLNGQPAEFLDHTDVANPMAGPTENYTYIVQTDDPRVCKDFDTVNVFIDTSVTVDAPQDLLIVCRPSYINLQAVTKGPAPLANLFCGTADPITCLAQDQDTATIGGGTNPALQPRNTPFYTGSTYHKYQYIIPKRDLLNAGLYSGTINALAFLHINPSLVGTEPLENVTIGLACVPFESFPETATNADFVNTTPVATLTNYALTANDWNQINFASPYSWDTTTNLLVDFCVGPMTAVSANGNDPVAMTPGSAIQKYDNAINVCGGNGAVQTYTERPVTRFMYCPSPELPFNFTWVPGTFLNDSSEQNPIAYVPRTITYAVTTIGRNGCRVRDSLHIVVPEHHIDRGPLDSVACVNQPVPLWATGGDAYQWFDVSNDAFTDASASLSCTNCANPIATPAQTTTYAVVFSNDVDRGNPLNEGSSLGCPDTLFLTVNINPLPPVHSSNRDTTIGYGKSVRLYATGATNYTWTPVGSLDNPNSPAPLASPTQTTNYVVSGMDSNGCVYRDTVKVMVDYKNNLLIPSAFTPNGDGRNDIFKVVNPSFQRLIEFRVFNRWGQEVFSTQDILDGWDGKWKGAEQAMGNYQYLIRVAYPDGNVETYKGDISLIR